MLVTLLIHPNRLGAGEPAGYRFAVHLTPNAETLVDPTDLATVVNAGWRPTLEAAQLDGQDQAATACHALELAGLEVSAAFVNSDFDHHPPT